MNSFKLYHVFVLSLFCSIVACSLPVSKLKASLPEKLIVGYAWNVCDDRIIEAARNGVNVIMWSFIDLKYNTTSNKPYVSGGPNPECVGRTVQQLNELNLETIHLVSIGGWNAPHPDTRSTPEEAFAEWKRWNEEEMARPNYGFYGYDGFDWDIEGNDDFDSPHNIFTVQCLDFMGEFSQLAKQNGYLVTMAPAESYMDPTTTLFDRNLTHSYQEWDPIVPNFNYHGHNPYSYLISRYGSYITGNSQEAPTFDFIFIQLYEGYSHTLFNTTIGGQPASEYIQNIVEQFDRGWFVEFSSDPDISWLSWTVQVQPQRLVVGLANGWADNTKFLLLSSTEVCLGYKYLQENGKDLRGFGFWTIKDEGNFIPSGEQMWLAKDLDMILNVRHNYTSPIC